MRRGQSYHLTVEWADGTTDGWPNLTYNEYRMRLDEAEKKGRVIKVLLTQGPRQSRRSRIKGADAVSGK